MSNPEISVVVRAHDEQDKLPLALQSLNNQEGISPSLFEVIIIDNASTDRTSKVAHEFLQNNPEFPGRVVYEERLGRGQALHQGVLEAKADFIAFLDADSEAAFNWLASILAFMIVNQNVVAGSGHIEFHNGLWHHRVLYPILRDLVYTVAAKLNKGWISGANWWIRKEVYHRTGGTGDLPACIISDDKILAIRTRKTLRGREQIAYCPGIVVETDNWLTEKPTWLTNIQKEFEQVRQATNTQKSLLHRLMEKASPILSRWDGVKRKIGLLPLNYYY